MTLMTDDLVDISEVTQPLYGSVADSTLTHRAGLLHLHKSFAASLLVHLLVLACVFMLRPVPRPLPVTTQPEPAWQSVLVVSRNPQRRLPDSSVEPAPGDGGAAAAEGASAGEAAGSPAADASVSGSEETIEAAAPATVPAVAINAVQPLVLTEAILPPAANPAPATIPEGSANGTLPTRLTPAEVQRAVSTFVDGYRQTLSSAWVQGCVIEQKSKGVRDCPEQRSMGADTESAAIKAARALADGAFASVTGPRRNAALLRELEQDSRVRLVPLMAKGGLLGEMATFRFHMNLEYQRYLGGNFNFDSAAFLQANTAGQADVRGNGNMAFDRGYLQPRCHQMPCVWNYTGFSVEPRQSGPEDADSFSVVPSLFGSRR